jgi:hypothetical protein
MFKNARDVHPDDEGFFFESRGTVDPLTADALAAK